MKRDEDGHWSRVARVAAGEGEGPARVPEGLAARAAAAAFAAAAAGGGGAETKMLLGQLVWLGTRALVASFCLAAVLLATSALVGDRSASGPGAGGAGARPSASTSLSEWREAQQMGLEAAAARMVAVRIEGLADQRRRR